MENNSEIVKFYGDRSVFLTGATGYLGIATMEKMLRSFPALSKLYILVRPKQGSDIHTRLAELLKGPMFEEAMSKNPGVLSKIIPIAGDITLPELGISEEDRVTLCENVSIVIHSAATVKFDEKLKIAINTNVGGTQRVVKLAEQMKNLVALVHVSTAYSNCHDKFVPESIRALPFEAEKLIECIQSLDDDTAHRITPELIGNRQNTYAFSKALAENILGKEIRKLPICIVRPSMVTPIYKDPKTMAGWTNNIYGPIGVLASYGKGILRTICVHEEKIVDLIPLDYVVNSIIAAAWEVGTTRPKSIKVYNCCTGSTNPILVGEFRSFGIKALNENPLRGILWHPSATVVRTLFMLKVFDFFVHFLPAFLMSALGIGFGPKLNPLKMYHKLNKALLSFAYFNTHEWDFEWKNLQNLHDQMCPQDKILFSLDVNEIDWKEYMKIFGLGIRKFILYDDPETLPAARQHLRKMYWVDKITKLGFVLLLYVLFVLLV